MNSGVGSSSVTRDSQLAWYTRRRETLIQIAPLRALWPSWQHALLSILSCLLAAHYLRVHGTYPIRGSDAPARNWFLWADQGEYYKSAIAWAAGNLADSQHHYPAGYSLIAAIFVPFMPNDPFLVPNLLFWTSSLWIFAALAQQLAPPRPGMRAVGGTVFFLVTAVDREIFYTWETPWSSTPACMFTLLSLLMALRYADNGRVRTACAAALSVGLIILFRPTDFLVIATAVGIFLAIAACRHVTWRTLVGALTRAGLAFLAGPLLLAITHLATHGATLGAYIELSAQIGFEWRLLPIRWVTLMLSPLPLYPDGQGLAHVYWWILPGIAGIIASALADQGQRLKHCFIGGTALSFLCVYLCYRDLQAKGMFDYMNQHYFKWIIPVFALYALGLGHMLFVQRKPRAAAVGICAAALLSCWRAEMVITEPVSKATISADAHGLWLPEGLAPLDTAYIAASPDDFVGLFLGPHTMTTTHGQLLVNAAFRVIPVPYGFMLMPLRVLSPTPATLTLKAQLRLARTEPVLRGTQRIVFGLPCLVRDSRAACTHHMVLKPRS